MSGHYTESIKKPSKIDAKSINKSSKIDAKSIKHHQNGTKKRKRRFYENERFAYTKHSFSWFQDMLLESKVRVQINVCCFSYFFCFAIRFSSFFIDCGFQNHFLKPWKWVFRVCETLIFIKSPFLFFGPILMIVDGFCIDVGWFVDRFCIDVGCFCWLIWCNDDFCIIKLLSFGIKLLSFGSDGFGFWKHTISLTI